MEIRAELPLCLCCSYLAVHANGMLLFIYFFLIVTFQ